MKWIERGEVHVGGVGLFSQHEIQICAQSEFSFNFINIYFQQQRKKMRAVDVWWSRRTLGCMCDCTRIEQTLVSKLLLLLLNCGLCYLSVRATSLLFFTPHLLCSLCSQTKISLNLKICDETIRSWTHLYIYFIVWLDPLFEQANKCQLTTSTQIIFPSGKKIASPITTEYLIKGVFFLPWRWEKRLL